MSEFDPSTLRKRPRSNTNPGVVALAQPPRLQLIATCPDEYHSLSPLKMAACYLLLFTMTIPFVKDNNFVLYTTIEALGFHKKHIADPTTVIGGPSTKTTRLLLLALNAKEDDGNDLKNTYTQIISNADFNIKLQASNLTWAKGRTSIDCSDTLTAYTLTSGGVSLRATPPKDPAKPRIDVSARPLESWPGCIAVDSYEDSNLLIRVADPSFLQALAAALRNSNYSCAIVQASVMDNPALFLVSVSGDHTQHQYDEMIKKIIIQKPKRSKKKATTYADPEDILFRSAARFADSNKTMTNGRIWVTSGAMAHFLKSKLSDNKEWRSIESSITFQRLEPKKRDQLGEEEPDDFLPLE